MRKGVMDYKKKPLSESCGEDGGRDYSTRITRIELGKLLSVPRLIFTAPP